MNHVLGANYLLHIDAVACATEDKTCSHSFSKPPCLGIVRWIMNSVAANLLDSISPLDLPSGN